MWHDILYCTNAVYLFNKKSQSCICMSFDICLIIRVGPHFIESCQVGRIVVGMSHPTV